MMKDNQMVKMNKEKICQLWKIIILNVKYVRDKTKNVIHFLENNYFMTDLSSRKYHGIMFSMCKVMQLPQDEGVEH